MPFFSIIIPTYNSATTIAECIESILSQTFSDFEILVQDGLSSDNTLEIIRKYQDIRIKIYSEKDAGVYDAMNRSIDYSSGEWLYFLGSDDRLYDRDILQKVKDSVKPHFSVLYGNVLIDGDTAWAKSGSIYDGYFSLSKILKKNISHQAIFYRNSLFKQGLRYNINYTVCADWDLCLYLYSKCRFLYIDEIISIFKGGALSSNLIDIQFNRDRWSNVVKYFNMKCISKEFIKYDCQIYSASSFMSKSFLVKIFYSFIRFLKIIRQ